MRPVHDAIPHSHKGNVGFLIAGVLLIVISAVVGLVLTAGMYWAKSVCADTPTVVSHRQHQLRASLLFVWLGGSLVPASWAVLAWKRKQHTWPWVVLSGAFIALAVSLSLSVQPGRWCLY